MNGNTVEARRQVDEIIRYADQEAVEAFAAAVKQAGQSTTDGTGMWQDSNFEDLVQYNDGFRTGLVGSATGSGSCVRADRPGPGGRTARAPGHRGVRRSPHLTRAGSQR